MRILLISHNPYAPPWDEGVKNLLKLLVLFLEDRNIEVEITSLRTSKNSQNEIPLGSRARILFELSERVRVSRPNVILLFTSCRSWLGLKSLLIKTVAHNTPLVLYVTSVGKPVMGYKFLICADRILVNSPFLHRFFPGAPLIYPFTPLELPECVSPSVRPDRNSFNLLFLGAWEPGRGVEVLIEAVGKASKDIPIHLTLALNSHRKLSENQLRELINQNGAEHCIEVKGEVDLTDAYSTCDVVIIPRTNDQRMAFPVRIMEALAMRKPLIVTTACDMGLLVEGAGLAVPPRDAASLANAIIRMYRDVEFYTQCIENTERLSKRYNSHASLERLLEELHNVAR